MSEKILLDFQNILQVETALTDETNLENMEEWDSLAHMAVMAYFDKQLNKKIPFSSIRECKTVKALLALL